ncbi:hypothetical protein JOD54_000092 [Actinokineospora baliensis]|uniref:hypothetical protein n=1 Tax=Actinokineospora baliensis TaxID=547056 RepID=UPI00195DC885|nr:hypothetical protein [Actinokineospora baliensis]MBM7769888.1 hypothetical protein [Actinokineospora baliensis]
MSVVESDLGTWGRELGKGGEAVVHELPGYKVADRTGPLVYKRYRKAHEDPQRLRGIVRLRGALTPARRAVLDRVAAWPCRVVENEDGDVIGLVLPRIPSEYTTTVVSPTGTRSINPCEVQYLFIDPSRARRLALPTPTAEERLTLCRDFASGLAFLHDELNVAFGDINHANELFKVHPDSGVYFIDCDGVRPLGTVTSHQQLNTPDWVPPEGDALSPETDRYKLGLFILRCLTPGAATSGRVDPDAAASALDQTGLGLLRLAVGRAPGARPEAAQWRRYLNALLGHHEDPPELTLAEATRPYVLLGQPVEIAWAAEHATQIEVSADGRAVVVDGGAGHGTVAIDLRTTGFVDVRARNDLGARTARVGPIPVIEPPKQVTMPILMPPVVFPELDHAMPALTLPALPGPTPVAPPVITATGHPAVAPLRLHVAMAPPIAVEEVIGAGPVFTFDRSTPAEEA